MAATEWIDLFKYVIDRWFSIPGAIVTVTLCLAFVPAFRTSLAALLLRGIKAKIPGVGEYELATPTEVSGKDEALGKSVNPAAEAEESPPEQMLEEEAKKSAAEPDTSELSREDELFREMVVAAHRDKDILALDKAYKELAALEDRKRTNESLETFYARLKLAMGEQDAIEDLRNLEAENNTWTLPSLRLAEFLASVESFDQALHHVGVGLERAETDDRRVLLHRLRADIFAKTDKVRQALGDLV